MKQFLIFISILLYSNVVSSTSDEREGVNYQLEIIHKAETMVVDDYLPELAEEQLLKIDTAILFKNDLGKFNYYKLRGLIAKRLLNYPSAHLFFNLAKKVEGIPKEQRRALNKETKYTNKRIRQLTKHILVLDSLQSIAQNNPNFDSHRSFHSQLARAFVKLNKLDSAQFHLDQSIFHLDDNPVPDQIQMRYHQGMGDIAYKNGSYKQAVEAHELAVRFAEQTKRPKFIFEVYYDLTKDFYKLGQFELALTYSDKALDYANRSFSGYKIWLSRIHRYYIYHQTGKSNLAQKELMIIKGMGELQDETNNEMLQKAMMHRDIETQNNKMLVMDLRNQMQADSLQNSKLIIGLFSTLLLFLTGFIYNILKQKKLIADQKTQIQKSLTEKEFLLKEIHHRVKNNLQVISSLLKLQSNSLIDKKAQRALDEGRNRVRSMALIHQNLYQEGANLSGINVKSYLNQLCNELIETYNYSINNVSLDLKIEEILLDVDSLVPIGLIVNELVSNSLKHAFDNEQEASINISLSTTDENLLELTIADNGRGFDIKKVNPKSFGLRLVKSFAERLNATYTFESISGSSSKFLIKDFKIAA